MKGGLVICLIVLATAGAVFGQCGPTNTCAPAGEACNPSTTEQCEGNADCVPTTPGATTFLCVLKEDIQGRSCNSDSDCFTGSSLGAIFGPNFRSCENGACRTPRLVPGDFCQAGSDCISGSCTDGECTTGLVLGSACTSTIDCPVRSTCTDSVCTALVEEGEPCTMTSVCVQTATCLNGACTRYFSVPGGAQCSQDANCEEGLTCAGGTCASNTAVAGTACSDDSPCGNGRCTCDHETSATVCVDDVNQCTGDVMSFYECTADCHVFSNLGNQGSCVHERCTSAAASGFFCGLNPEFSGIASSCLAGLPSPASSVESALFF